MLPTDTLLALQYSHIHLTLAHQDRLRPELDMSKHFLEAAEARRSVDKIAAAFTLQM